MIDFSLYIQAFVPVLMVALLTWLISLYRHDVSVIDSAWSLMFLAAGIFLVSEVKPDDVRSQLIIVLVVVWSMRLFIHLTVRNWGEPEDRRYVEIRERYSPNFALKSLFIIFIFQAILAWIILLPLVPALTQHTAFSVLDWLGVLLWVVGFLVEAVADWQLRQFKSNPHQAGQVMDQGLWHYSRHPNYFGECLIWWGFFCFAASVGAWITIIGPLLMTWLLLKFSGVVMLEATIVQRRPAYAEYIQKTPAFFPGFPKQ